MQQVQLEGGPCDGWQHIVTEHQMLITIPAHDGVEVYGRSNTVPVIFEYDGLEPWR